MITMRPIVVTNRFAAIAVAFVVGLVSPQISPAQNPTGNPYRYRQELGISFGYKGEPHFYDFIRQWPYCEVDLLLDANVQKELDLTKQTIALLPDAYSKYLEAVLSTERDRLPDTDRAVPGSGKDVATPRDFVLDLISDSKRNELLALDRFLYFRRFGVCDFLKSFESASISSLDFEQLTADESAIWSAAAKEGEKLWIEALDEISIILNDEEAHREFFNAKLVNFKGLYWADITICALNPSDDQPRENDVSEKDEFEALVRRSVQYCVKYDGSWDRTLFQSDELFADNLNFFLATLGTQSRKDGGNDVEILDYQFGQLGELSTAYFDQQNELLNEGQNGNLDKTTIRKLDGQQKQKYFQGVWEVLLPVQRDYLLEHVRQRERTIAGPVCLLSDDSLPTTAKKKIRNELEWFEKQLLKIESNTHRQLLRLLEAETNSHFNLSLDTRPVYLRPSLTIMSVNSRKGRSDPKKN